MSAPPEWRRIDFISDLHLQADKPRTHEAFANYLERTPADAVMILGDLFEAWVGDDMRELPFEAACTRELAGAAHRLWLGLMVGNRDFLLGQDMRAACNAHALPDPTVLTAFEQRYLLVHGDAWCLADTSYLAFRAQARSSVWQDGFLSMPLSARLVTARALREGSEARKTMHPGEPWADVDERHADDFMTLHQAPTLIHGHTHHPASQSFGSATGQRHVLSDWDLDEAPHRADVLRLSSQGIERLTLDQAMAHPRA